MIQTPAPALTVESLGIAFGDRVILSDVSFELPARGLTLLVGPAGSGKSALQRTLAGLNDGHPALAIWGRATFRGAPMIIPRGDEPGAARPALVAQHARFFLDTLRENLVSALPNRGALQLREQTEVIAAHLVATGLEPLIARLDESAVALPLALQRRLAIARALLPNPAVLFTDEPTAGLEDGDAYAIINMLRAQAEHRSILLVTHNQKIALAAGGTTLLLAGGRIHEQSATEQFFSNPRSELGRLFLRTGGCTPASEDTVSPSSSIPPVVAAELSRFIGPRGFFWVRGGALGGMPRPGLIDRLEHDLEGLKRLGATVLVTLEETALVDPVAVRAAGIRPVHFPIADMCAPELAAAIALSRDVDRWMRDGEVIVVHCRAGLGRTGLVLACQLIAMGETARGALEAVRAINPKCVQSAAQVSFLESFARSLRSLVASPDGGRIA